MDVNNIISSKRNVKANLKYGSDYETLTHVQKRTVSLELKREKKTTGKAKFTQKHGETKVKEIVEKRKNTTVFNAEVNKSFKIFNKDAKYNKVLGFIKDYSNRTIRNLPVTIKGHDVVQMQINKNKMTREEIKQISQRVSNEMQKLGVHGTMYVTLKYNENKYRSSQPRHFGQPVNLFHGITYNFEEDEDNDQEFFNSFTMYLIEDNAPHGGNSKDNNNNCFYDCLKEILKDNLKFNDAYEFKKHFKIGYGSKVHLNHIQKIEEFIKVAINVTGDYTHISQLKNCYKIINLKLIDEHYTLDMKNSKEVGNNNKKISYTNKKPILYDTTTFNCFDGEKEYFLTKEFRNKIYSWKTNHILINKSDNKNKTLQDEYNDFINDADILLKETNELINLYKTGNTKTTALNLFYQYNKHIKPDNILQCESDFINGASIGALMHCEPGLYDECFKYDIVSQYPSIMDSRQMIPIKEGEFKNITIDEFKNMKFYSYGIYRCKITGLNKSFKLNENNYYTHIDLNNAKDLNLKIDLIEDGQPNFLYYSRDKLLCCSEIFNQYVSLLFKLKQNGIKKAKAILNILWGAICQKKIKTIFIDNNNTKKVNLDGNITVKRIRPFNDDQTMIEYVKNNQQFYSNYARIKPFILGKAREMLSKLIKNDVDSIVWIHTDGIMSIKKLNIQTGNELGQLKYEGNCKQAQLIHLNKIIGKFNL